MITGGPGFLDPARRGWVLQHEKSYATMEGSIRQRLQVVYDKLWKPGSAELFWRIAVPVLLGRVAPLEGAALFAQECAAEAGTEKARDDFPAFLLLQLGMLYLSRIGATHPQVGIWVSPNRIKTGYVHFLDFTEDELAKLLDEADKAHGVSFWRGLFRQALRFDDVKPPPEGSAKSGPDHPMYFVSEEYKVKMREEFHRFAEAFNLDPQERESAAKVFEEGGYFYSPEFLEWQMNAMRKSLGKIVMDEAEIQRYETERIISLSRIDRQKAVEELAAMELAKRATASATPGKEEARAKYEAVLDALGPPRNPPPNKQTDPDAVYALYNIALTTMHYIHEKTKDLRRPETVLPELQKLGPQLTKEKFRQIIDDLRTMSPFEVAIKEAAEMLGISESYCEVQMKMGSRTAKVNAVWKVFFDGPGCPFNLPADLNLRPESQYLLERISQSPR